MVLERLDQIYEIW